MADIQLIVVKSKFNENPKLDGLIADIHKDPRVRIIDRYTTSLNELLILARYRVLQSPTILFVVGSKLVGRLSAIPKHATVLKLMDDLSR